MTIDRTCRVLILLAVIAVAVIVTRDFVRYVDHYPYLAADDALANVSYAWGSAGRYGFLTSPFQGFSGLPRHDGFFNYGPWYFFAGAVAVWLFGYSLELLRSLHLLGILGISAIACGWFWRRGQVLAGAIVALGMIYSFGTNQWPMVRPDIAVSVFAAMFIVAAGYAIEENSTAGWALAGLASGCGALSHLIAWTLVIDGLVVCAIVCMIERARPSVIAKRFLAITSGLVLASVMFYGSFDFRIRDHLSMLSGYGRFLEGTSTAGAGFVAVVGLHLWQAFWNVTRISQVAIAAGTTLAVALLSLGLWRPFIPHRRLLGLLLPPVIVMGLYVGSIGFYPNFHAGYAILTQVAIWWCIASAAALLLELVGRRQVIASVLSVLLIGAVAVNLSISLSRGARLEFVHDWVSISEYTDRIGAFIPLGETAWGSAMFGIETPKRLELVEPGEAVFAVQQARKQHPVYDRDVAPSYLIWGYPNNRNNTLAAIQPPQGTPVDIFNRIDRELPSAHYRLIGLVSGAPYGVTRVYSRGVRSSDGSFPMPTVNHFDVETQQWLERLEGPIPTHFTATEPATFALGAGPRDPVRATRTVKSDLPAGRFLVRVRLGRSSGSIRPTIVGVTSSPSFSEVIGELGPSVDFAPYGSADDVAYLLHKHRGGAMYVSQFDEGHGAEILGVDVYGIADVLRNEQVAPPMFRPMPAAAEWLPLTPRSARAVLTDGGVAVDGDGSWQGYQFQSPPVFAEPGSTVTVRLEFQREQGAVCVGALGKSETVWLGSNADPTRDFSFVMNGTKSFSLVLHNCNASKEGNPASRFRLGAVRYAIKEPGLYVDRLIAQLAPSPPDLPEVLVFPPGLTVADDVSTRPVSAIMKTDLRLQASMVHEEGSKWIIEGVAETPYAYLLQSKARRVPSGGMLAVAGNLKSGGLSIGIVRDGSWAGQVAVKGRGAFFVVVAATEGGDYEAVVASNSEAVGTPTSVAIERFGWLPR